MSEKQTRASTAPVWLGVLVGGALGLAGGLSSFLVLLSLGFGLGYLVYSRRSEALERAALGRRLDEMFERVALLEYAIRRMPSAAPSSAARSAPVSGSAVDPRRAAPGVPEAAPSVPPFEPAAAREEAAAHTPAFPPSSPPPDRERSAVRPTLGERAIAAAQAWLLGGNTVARVGLLVLFIGVAFLLRYLAEHTRIPIELRLAAVAAGALVLLAFGWRLRAQRFGYAVTLQGGAVGILYLTVYSALRLYEVLGAVPAFALLAVLAVLSGVLSIVQNARALAALGAAGGFLAPILVSTSSGRIELLLAYYLLLDLAVLGVAWFRAWRELNWIAFAFTFGVLALWALESYTPMHYAMGQGFLVAFWLLFLGVSLLYALRQPEATRGLFDTTLVFALPLAAFGIQSRFADGVDLALASLVAAAAYFASSALLLKRREPALRVLTEANFSVGVAFLTLALPLAASAEWTAAAWALEGVALTWVGMRQRRWLPLAAGQLLHVAGALALGYAVLDGDVSLHPAFSGLTLNLLVMVATAFAGAVLTAYAVAARAEFGPEAKWLVDAVPWSLRLVGWVWVAALVWQPLPYPWYAFAWCTLALGLLAVERSAGRAGISPEWVAGLGCVVLAWVTTQGHGIIDHIASGASDDTMLLRLAVAATAFAGALMSWAGVPARRAAAGVLLTLGVLAWLGLFREPFALVDGTLAAAQPALLFVVFVAAALAWLGARLRASWPLRLSWLQFGAHLVLAAATVLLAARAGWLPSRHAGWLAWPLAWIAYYARLRWDDVVAVKAPLPGLLHVGGLWLLSAMAAAEVALRLEATAGDGWFFAAWGAVPALALWFVVQYAARWPMNAAVPAYAHVGAPGLALFAIVWTLVSTGAIPGDATPWPYLPLLNPLDLSALLMLAAVLRWHVADRRAGWQRPVRFTLAGTAFIALNAAALRAVHVYAGVPWDIGSLGRSLVVQSVLSLLWTTTALGLMVLAHRRALRPVWLAGGALLGAVVLKLFFVDLAGRGTIEQIVSFVGVGLLILLIGYLAPVPPAAASSRG